MAFALSIGKFTRETQKKAEKIAFEAVSDEFSKVITETAGFVPLEVRFQKLQENGIRLQLRAQEFDSVDMRRLYLDDEFRVEPDDELEDIEEKIQRRNDFLNELKAREKKSAGVESKTSPEDSPEKSASESAPSLEEED